MATSVFHLDTIGRVAANKELGNNEIQVYFNEHRYGVDEETLKNPQTEEVTYQTGSGERKAAVNTDVAFPCKWLKRNSNRITAPDVRRDDEVLVWRLGDSDEYFWEDSGNANVKRLETVIWAFSADPNGPITGDLSNAYVIELSTHEGVFGIHTSQSNGEPFGWAFQIDAKGGRTAIESTGGEHVLIDSNEKLVEMVNADKSNAGIKGRNAFIKVPDNILLDAGNTQEFHCKKFIVKASEGVEFETPKVTCSDDLYVGGKTNFTGSVSGSGAEFSQPVKAPSFEGPCNKAH